MSQSPPFSVRRGEAGDLDLLVEGNAAMALETEGLALHPSTLRSGVATVLQGRADAWYHLALAPDGSVAGQLMITREWSDWRNGQVWWIQSVYVWPQHRRQGVYAALYRQVLDDARDAGAAGVRLYVDDRNGPAQAVYTRLGMDGEHYRVFETMLVDLPLADDSEA